MQMKYPVITLCGSTRFKDEFAETQKRLTLDGFVVISVGLFGHSGDSEVWEGKDEDTVTKTKRMLDDMHKAKIDMADGIFVVNPGGYIGASTWSEICYAKMTKKEIRFMEPVSEREIDTMVSKHTEKAKELAFRQYDAWWHFCGGPELQEAYLKNMVVLEHEGETVLDPWIPEQQEDNDTAQNGTDGVDPFAVYGRNKMARFIEELVQREQEWEEKEWVWSEFEPVMEER